MRKQLSRPRNVRNVQQIRPPATAEPARPRTPTPVEAIQDWQRLVGNQAVSRALAGERADGRALKMNGRPATPLSLMREEEEPGPPANLHEALGYQSKLEIADKPITSQGHPMSMAILKGTRAILEAKLIEQDGSKAVRLYSEVRAITGNLRESLRKLGDQAPHRFMWSMEEMAWGHVLGELESGFSSARRGRWAEGWDNHWYNIFNALDQRLITGFMAHKGGTSREIITPGGKFKQRIPIGVYPVPAAVLNVYLVMEGEKKAGEVGKPDEGGAASGGIALEVDEQGNLKGGGDLNLSGPAGSKVTAEASKEGPAISAQTGKAEAGGASMQGSAKLSGSGAEAGLTFENPEKWSANVKATSGGALSYQLSHPEAGGVSISGQVGKLTMQLLVPEIKAGDYTFKATVEIEVIPAPQLWSKSLTQTADMVRFANAYYGTLLALATIPASGALAAEISAATTAAQLPRVVIVLRPAFAAAL